MTSRLPFHPFTAHALLRYVERFCGFEDEVREARALAIRSNASDEDGFALMHVLAETKVTPLALAEQLTSPGLLAAIASGAKRYHDDEITFCIRNGVIPTVYERSSFIKPRSKNTGPTHDLPEEYD